MFCKYMCYVNTFARKQSRKPLCQVILITMPTLHRIRELPLQNILKLTLTLAICLLLGCDETPPKSTETGATLPNAAITPTAEAPAPVAPKIPADELHARIKAANSDYNGKGQFRYGDDGELVEVVLAETGVRSFAFQGTLVQGARPDEMSGRGSDPDCRCTA